MSNPSFDNIDKWLFEYMEGNLSPHQETQLKQFLLQNPELDQDLDAWRNATVDATPVFYPNIDSHIRKPIAWWIPSAAVSVLVGVSVFAWMNFDTTPKNIQIADSAHTIEKSQLKASVAKGNSYFASKRSADHTDWKFDLIDLNFPIYMNTWEQNMPFCGGNTVSMNDFRLYDLDSHPLTGNINMLSSASENFRDKNSNSSQVSDKASDEIKSVSSNDINKEDLDLEELNKNAKAMSRTENRSGSGLTKSFSSKMKSMIRKVVRMTDNPVALSNSKDIFYHTPGMQSMDVNFGSVGSLLTPRLQTITRAQWTGHSNQQFTNQLSFDTYVKSIRGGVGVQVNHVYYRSGAYQIGQFALMYSPKFAISKNVVIEPAIRFKMGNKRLDNQKMIPGQLVELDRQNQRLYNGEGIQTNTQSLWYKDVGLALMSNTKWFSAGIQVDNLGRHYNNVYNSSNENDRQGYHFTATVGTDYVSKTKLFSFSPYIMYQKVENLSEIWGGSIFRYKKLTIGGGFSSLGDYAGSIGVKTNRLMLTYTVDNTQSVLLSKKLFSQQLTLRILTNRNRNDYRMLNL